MKEIYPNIFCITEKGSLGAIKPPENIYILAGKNGLIFDAGYGSNRDISQVFNAIKRIYQIYQKKGRGIHIERILPSHAHPDHIAGLKKLKKKLGLKILLTKRMHSIIKTPHSFFRSHVANTIHDLLYTQGGGITLLNLFQQLSWYILYRFVYGLKFIEDSDGYIPENGKILINGEEWKIIHSPGHAPDHISLYNSQKGILLAGDNILRSITTWLGPPNSDIKAYMETLLKLKSLENLRIILPAHGSPILHPKERINEIITHRKKREKLVHELVKENSQEGITPTQILQRIYPGANIMFYRLARGWVCLTLKLLEEKGKIQHNWGENEFVFHSKDKK